MGAAITAPRTWFRFYSEAINDRKIARTARIVGCDKVVVLGVWVGLLSLASESPERGALLLAPNLPFTVTEIAEELGCPEETLQAIIGQFDALDMVGWDENILIIAHWADRQFESDNSTERVRRFRERRTQRCGNVTVTDHSIAEHSIAEQSREEVGARVAIESTLPAPEMPSETPAQPPKPKRSPRPGRIADDKPIPKPSEAVQAYRELMHLWPSATQQAEINKQVRPETVPRWRECVMAWEMRGYNKRNVAGMLEWYQQGIPANGSRASPGGRQSNVEKSLEAGRQFLASLEVNRGND